MEGSREPYAAALPTLGVTGHKTLLVTNDFPPRRGGIETLLSGICAAFPPGALVVYTSALPAAYALGAEPSYPVVRDRAGTLLPTPRVADAVVEVARRHGCDAVVFGASAPLGLLARTLRRRAGVRHVAALTHGHEIWWAKVPGARMLLRRIAGDADVLTYVSAHCRDSIAAALPPETAGRMRRLSPVVDRSRFHAGVDGSSWRRRLRLPIGAPVVLCASRLVRRKGQDFLVRAWPAVRAVEPDARLVIVGDGPDARRLRDLAHRGGVEDCVTFAPSVPWEEMPQVYAMADVFALPCRTRRGGLEVEAFGMVFQEAAACGLPLVVGASGGAPEAAESTGSAHVTVVDPTDIHSVGAGIVSALGLIRGHRHDADR